MPALTKQLFESRGQLALDTLWAIHLIGGLDEALAEKNIKHAEPQVRLWTVRLLADDYRLGEKIASALPESARQESNVYVRSQMAAQC